MPDQSFKETIDHHEHYLRWVVDNTAIPAPLIKEAITYSLFPGGKRLRPLLTYLTGELLTLDRAVLDPLAAAVELMHCYSLIHDDLPAMDNDDFRRGKPSCHKAFDEATAILAGDGLQGMAIEALLNNLPANVGHATTLALVKELVIATGVNGMVSGQSLDLSELQKPDLSEAELKTIHQLKTGCLFSACIKMPILIANPPASQCQALEHFGQILGLVFQMQDDYLDHYADPSLLGKMRSSDLSNHKTTFAVLYGKEALLEQINAYYQEALLCLEIFPKTGSALRDFVLELWQRTASHQTA